MFLQIVLWYKTIAIGKAFDICRYYSVCRYITITILALHIPILNESCYNLSIPAFISSYTNTPTLCDKKDWVSLMGLGFLYGLGSLLEFLVVGLMFYNAKCFVRLEMSMFALQQDVNSVKMRWACLLCSMMWIVSRCA